MWCIPRVGRGASLELGGGHPLSWEGGILGGGREGRLGP